MAAHNACYSMNALALVNSASPDYPDAAAVLAYLDHFGAPYTLVDLNRQPLPADAGDYALVVVAHARLDPLGTRLSGLDQTHLAAAIRGGMGLVSFDPALHDSPSRPGGKKAPPRRVHAASLKAATAHYITQSLDPARPLELVSELALAQLPGGDTLIQGNGAPFLSAEQVGQGRAVFWASARWMSTFVLGPLAGLDGVFWRSLVWAARKPFALRGLPPLMTMRVDDVAGDGGRWELSPLYWVHAANRAGFKPWLGLFLYNLNDKAIDELRGLLEAGQATAFPHALGRPPIELLQPENREISASAPGFWHGKYYHPQALPPNIDDQIDQFIFYNHYQARPFPEVEVQRRLKAVDDWYAAHPGLPITPYGIPHWYEFGCSGAAHMHGKWGVEMTGKPMDLELPLNAGSSWLMSGPFRRGEKPGSPFPVEGDRCHRPVYYADFANLGGYSFFNCVTEIRDDGGYEWAPDNDVEATIARGVRQLRRAFDSMALPVLFTHETDFIWKIRPENWDRILQGVAAGIAAYHPIQVTMDEGVRYVRATRTSRLDSCVCELKTGMISAHLSGSADVATHFHLFRQEGDEIRDELVEVAPFEGDVEVVVD